MARLYAVRTIGYGGEPSEYAITIGRRDIPRLTPKKDVARLAPRKGAGRRKLVIERVLCTVGDRDKVKIKKIERAVLYDYKGKKITAFKDMGMKELKMDYEIAGETKRELESAAIPIETLLIIACRIALFEKRQKSMPAEKGFVIGDRVMIDVSAALRSHAEEIPPHAGYTREEFGWRELLNKTRKRIGKIRWISGDGKDAAVKYRFQDDSIGIESKFLKRAPEIKKR